MSAISRRTSLTVIAITVCAMGVVPANADVFEWSVGLDGFFVSPGPWTRLSGTGSAPPGTGDTAIFNENRPYTASFTRSWTNEFLEVVDGSVTFRSDGTDRIYRLTSDAEIVGGDLMLGVFQDPLDLDVDNFLRVGGGSRLAAGFGSNITVDNQLRIGANNQGDGEVYLAAGSQLTVLNIVAGASGDNGTLTLNGADATINGSLNIAASGVIGSDGSFTVQNGGTMDLAGDLNLTTGNGSSQTGNFSFNGEATVAGDLNIGTGGGASQLAFFSISGASTTFTQSGAKTIDVGGPVAAGNAARLDVNGGMFTTGTGAIQVHPTGILDVADGSFVANGPVTLHSGASLVVEQGTFDATAGFDNTAGATIDLRNGVLKFSGGTVELTAENMGIGDDFIVTGAAAGDLPKLVFTNGVDANADQDLFLADGGTDAEMEVSGGAVLRTGTNSRFGEAAGSTATILVTGPTTRWNSGGLLGNYGTAELTIEDGATVNGISTLALNATGEGRITVTDQGSLWNGGFARIGAQGVGRLSVTSNGAANFSNITAGASSFGTPGTARIGVFSGGEVTVATDVYLGGSSLGDSGGDAELNLFSGAVEIGNTLRVFSNASVLIDSPGATLTANTIDHTHGGSFTFRNGTLVVDTFQGSLVNQSGVFSPGGGQLAGATVTGNLTHQNGSMLAIDVASVADIVSVAGNVAIDGELQLTLLPEFLPNPTTTYLALTAGGSLTGFFDNVLPGQRLDTIDGGGSFVVNYGASSSFDPSQIVLSNFLPTAVPGDFNGDDLVTLADYTVWRDNLGAADEAAINYAGDGLGGVNMADYNLWRSNYGNASLAMGQAASVPEPRYGYLLMIATAMLAASVRRAI